MGTGVMSVCTPMCQMHTVPAEARGGYQIPWDESYRGLMAISRKIHSSQHQSLQSLSSFQGFFFPWPTQVTPSVVSHMALSGFCEYVTL